MNWHSIDLPNNHFIDVTLKYSYFFHDDNILDISYASKEKFSSHVLVKLKVSC